MYSKHPEESEKNPGEVVVNRAIEIASIRTFVHAGDKEQINNPADEKKAKGEQPDDPRDGPSVVKTMGSHKAENPQNIADDYTVTVVAFHKLNLAEAVFPSSGNPSTRHCNQGGSQLDYSLSPHCTVSFVTREID